MMDLGNGDAEPKMNHFLYQSIKRMRKRHAIRQLEYAFKTFAIFRNHYIVKISHIMIQSKKRIANAFSKYLIRRRMRGGEYLVSIYWDDFSHKNSIFQMEITGDFTIPPWTARNKLIYNSFFKAGKIDVWMREQQQFKFIINGKYMISERYKSISVEGGFTNNVFVLNRNNDTNSKVYSLGYACPNLLLKRFKMMGYNSNRIDSLNSKYAIPSLMPQFVYNPTTERSHDEDEFSKLLRSLTEKPTRKSTHIPSSYNKIERNGDTENSTILPRRIASYPTTPIKLTNKLVREYKLISSVSSIAKDDRGGEDASLQHEIAIGVADGVGGWAEYGLNAGQFSHALMAQTLNIINESEKERKISPTWSPSLSAATATGSTDTDLHMTPSSSFTHTVIHKEISPKELLIRAFAQLPKGIYGSTTALLCVLRGGHVRIANIGDSKAVIIRFNAQGPYILMTTNEQQHAFNFPFQVSRVPNHSEYLNIINEKHLVHKFLLAKERDAFKNDLEDADLYIVDIQENDIIILGSDGVFDNLFGYEIVEIVKHIFKDCKNITQKQINDLANMIASEAVEKINTPDSRTPFQKKVWKIGHKKYRGGKQDDITVVAGWVVAKD